jgi:hypothetical protein
MYNSPFNQNNIGLFSNPFQSALSQGNSLEDAYQKLEFLKAQQNLLHSKDQSQIRNVFSDIANEWSSVSEDERSFIESSKEYRAADLRYQQEFTAFLIEYLGNDFLKSSHGKAAEEVLAVIKSKKDSYKNKFADDISEIRNKNSQLEQNNEILAKK